MDRKNYVILVDKNDRKIGLGEKMKAHDKKNGKLHRAISIFVFNKKGETMLQQRAPDKYHSKGKWSNTCCSHPMSGEKVLTAAHRRLREEMGFDCRMRKVFEFTYEAEVGSGLREREYDHIIFGRHERNPRINKDEVVDWKWISLPSLKSEIKKNPEKFTPWLRMMINKVDFHYRKTKAS